MPISVEHFLGVDKLSDAHSVRAEVFQREQGISAADDYDGQDDIAEQFVAYEDGKPIGTARYRVLPDKVGKVERVAVIKAHRGKKVGHAIMESVSETAKEQGLAKLVLDSQLSAADFYESLGYQKDGDEFDEVGISHIKMVLELKPEVPR